MSRRQRLWAAVTENEIDWPSLAEEVADDSAGGSALFLGHVRNSGEAGPVDAIIYEAYAKMAEKVMKGILEEAARRWTITRARAVHRTGRLGLGDVSVAIAVSAPHRKEAFEACWFIIDAIKLEVPIWKKERLAGGGERWVSGAPAAGTRRRAKSDR